MLREFFNGIIQPGKAAKQNELIPEAETRISTEEELFNARQRVDSEITSIKNRYNQQIHEAEKRLDGMQYYIQKGISLNAPENTPPNIIDFSEWKKSHPRPLQRGKSTLLSDK